MRRSWTGEPEVDVIRYADRGSARSNRVALLDASEGMTPFDQPLPPEELFDAKSERVHREPGRARAAPTVRNK